MSRFLTISDYRALIRNRFLYPIRYRGDIPQCKISHNDKESLIDFVTSVRDEYPTNRKFFEKFALAAWLIIEEELIALTEESVDENDEFFTRIDFLNTKLSERDESWQNKVMERFYNPMEAFIECCDMLEDKGDAESENLFAIEGPGIGLKKWDERNRKSFFVAKQRVTDNAYGRIVIEKEEYLMPEEKCIFETKQMAYFAWLLKRTKAVSGDIELEPLSYLFGLLTGGQISYKQISQVIKKDFIEMINPEKSKRIAETDVRAVKRALDQMLKEVENNLSEFPK